MRHLSDLVRGIRGNWPVEGGLTLDFSGQRYTLMTNEPRLVEQLREYFGEFVSEGGRVGQVVTAHEAPVPDFGLLFTQKAPDPGKSKIKEESVDVNGGRIVRKRLTGMCFLFGDGDHLAVGPCVENVNQVINFINNRYIADRLNAGCLLGHAAAVMHQGRGIAIAGISGAGKSTLALHMMGRGATFVSNDRLMVERNGGGLAMHGVAKLPRINPGTALSIQELRSVVAPDRRKKYEAMPAEKLWGIEDKHDVCIDRCFGPGRMKLAGPLDVLVILNWKRDGGMMRIRTAGEGDFERLLPHFMKSEGLFYIPGNGARFRDTGLNAYADLLRDCRVVEISGGVDFKAATAACLFMLSQRADA